MRGTCLGRLGYPRGKLWHRCVQHLLEGYALHEAIFGADGRMVDYRFLEYNPAAQRIAGIARADIVGKRALELYPHIVERGLMARYAEVMATGQSAIIEDFYYAGDSLDKAFDISCFKVDHRHFVCIFRDVTTLARDQIILRESNERLRRISKAGNIGLWEWNLATNEVFYSAEWKSQIGYDDHEITNHFSEWSSRVHPDDLEGAQKRVQDFLKQPWEQFENEFRFRHKDGSYRWILATASLRQDRDGRPLAMLGAHIDITARKRAEEALRESEERFRVLTASSPTGIYLTDATGRCVYANQKWLDMAGLTLAEAMGHGWAQGLHPEDRAQVFANWNRTAQAAGTWGFSYRFVDRAGTVTWVYGTAAPIVNAQGEITGYVGVNADITALKRAEADHLRLEGQLLHAMKMEAVGQLAGGVAHDFNNLLTGIAGNVALALMDLKPDDPLVATLSDVTRATDSAADLVRHLLAFSRKQLIEPRVLNLNDIIGSLHRMLSRLLGASIEFTTNLATPLGSVLVDPGQFEQILVNLSVNARDAMMGGGRLTMTTANVDLDESFAAGQPGAKAGRYVLLAVADTGHGMTEDVKRHLFEPFFTTKPKGRGTGLGLAIIYGAVKQAEGFLEVQSEPGQGSTFRIYLPRVEADSQRVESDQRAPDMPGGTETVLLVEDEQIVRDLAARILKRLGYKVLQAPEGSRAILLAEEYKDRIDLLMTDVVMPGMNGRQLATRLLGLHPEMKVLYSSGYSEDALGGQGIVEEGLHFLGKPYHPQALAKKLREILDGPAPSRR
jgi:PAS domain S-box-containing protein